MNVIPAFHLVSGSTVFEVLKGTHDAVVDVIAQAYELHDAGNSKNPDSYFLTFPDKPTARIIALPAYLGGQFDRAGLKWISSFPSNRDLNVPRASAVLILNDYQTGYPVACLEGSLISAHRTAASAVLAAEKLSQTGRVSERLAIVGSGLIARYLIEYLKGRGWQLGQVAIHDSNPKDAEKFRIWLGEKCTAATIVNDVQSACRNADLVIFATTAVTPHVHDKNVFDAAPTVLHLSLRDIDPALILNSQNITDDIEHSMKAQTSLHLTEQQSGSREFVAGTLADLMAGRLEPNFSKARIFSPFGLGVLDVALGTFVLERAIATGLSSAISGFFAETERWSI